MPRVHVTILPGLAQELVPGCRTRIVLDVEVPESATAAHLVAILGQRASESSILRTSAWRRDVHMIVNGRYATDPGDWELKGDDHVILMPVYGGG
jgi:molybdopterin converting factor small subunit